MYLTWLDASALVAANYVHHRPKGVASRQITQMCLGDLKYTSGLLAIETDHVQPETVHLDAGNEPEAAEALADAPALRVADLDMGNEPGVAQASQPGAVAAAPAPAAADPSAASMHQRKRKSGRKACAPSQTELDGRHPGNARHRAIIAHISNAWQIFADWFAATRPSVPEPAPAEVAPQAGDMPVDWAALTSTGNTDAAPYITYPQPQAAAIDEAVGHPHTRNCEGFDVADHASWQLRTQCVLHHLVQNVSDEEVTASVGSSRILLPPHSTFLMSDMRQLQCLLPQGHKKYRIILLDPPWENKSVQRSSAYASVPAYNFMTLPVPQLLDQDPAALVALWITNRERLLRFVEDMLLPNWGLQCVATWYWVKVTQSGRPIMPLTGMHRHPYEMLLLLRRKKAAPLSAVPMRDGHIIFSVPGAHSRKPQVGHLMLPLAGLQSHTGTGTCTASSVPLPCLELFARELQAGWTAWGNEPLHFQDKLLFDQL